MKIEEVTDAFFYKIANHIFSAVLFVLTAINLMFVYAFSIYLLAPYLPPEDYPTFSGKVISISSKGRSGGHILVDNGNIRQKFKWSCRKSPIENGEEVTIASIDLIRDPIFIKPRSSIIRRGGIEICRDGTVGLSEWKTLKIFFSFLLAFQLLVAFYTLKLAICCASNRTFDFSLRWR